jgi:hypothetical protein
MFCPVFRLIPYTTRDAAWTAAYALAPCILPVWTFVVVVEREKEAVESSWREVNAH